MPRGEFRTADQNQRIADVISELYPKGDYTDQAAAREILERHHIDISTIGVMLVRTKTLKLLKKTRAPRKAAGPTRVMPNLETAEGLMEALEQRVNTANERLEDAGRELTAAYDLLQDLKTKMDERPIISKDEAAALKVLRRKG